MSEEKNQHHNLGSNVKQVVLNIYNYCVRETEQYIGSCIERTSYTTGVGSRI